MSWLCNHDWYLDRTITKNGKDYNVWRCRKCGKEIYEEA